MQLHTIFHKTVNRNKMRVIGLVVLRKLSLDWKGEDGGGRGGGGEFFFPFFLFLSLFLSVHIILQYKSNSYKSLFITTVNVFSFIALLIFSHLQVH